jgi:hypothetical protein
MSNDQELIEDSVELFVFLKPQKRNTDLSSGTKLTIKISGVLYLFEKRQAFMFCLTS